VASPQGREAGSASSSAPDVGDEAEVRFGTLRLQPAHRRLLRDGQPVPLGARAFDVLTALATERHRIVTKAELLDRVWPDVVVEENNLAVQVSTLRKLVGPDVIATIPGRGYRFVAEVEGAGTDAQQTPAPSGPGAVKTGDGALTPDPTPLIGREADLALLAKLSAQGGGLVSIVGAGGIGKTRLARAHAQAERERWPDGVRWVDLAPLPPGGDVVAAIGRLLDAAPGPPPDVDRIARLLATKRLLLVLDNVEHVAPAAAAVARAVLAAAPGVQLLVTGQVALGLPGERVHRIQPLEVPAAGASGCLDYPAVRLFVERARADDLRFDATKRGAAEDIVAICSALDGLPLAIELAASRARLLGLAGLRERLNQRLRVLAPLRAADTPARQQTLRAALDWSHGLLAEREQRLLRRLAPFAGGFTLELAQDAASDAEFDRWDVLDALGVLVDRSIVAVDDRLAGTGSKLLRYRLLETMREFATERAQEAGEVDSVRRRHAQAVANMCAAADEWAFAEDAPPSAIATLTATVQPELDNVRVALAFSLAQGDHATALLLATTTVHPMVAAGALHDVLPTLRSLQPSLDTLPTPALQARCAWRLGVYGVQAGIAHAELLQLKKAAVDKARVAGGRRQLMRALAALGFAYTRQGDVAGAEGVLAELTTLERDDDPPMVELTRRNIENALIELRGDVPALITALQHMRLRLQAAGDESQLQNLYANDANLVLFLVAAGRAAEAVPIGLEMLKLTATPPPYVVAFVVMALSVAGAGDEALALARQQRAVWGVAPIGVYAAEAMASLALARGRLKAAVAIDAALERHMRRVGGREHPATTAFRARLAAALHARGIDDGVVQAWREDAAKATDAELVAHVLDDEALTPAES
jgi:predicted ATPase/DNA-binding winged helix-turn-helix (wHTH) protein